MGDLGRMLVFFGVLLVVIGSALILAGRAHLPLGRLPGDFIWRGRHGAIYFPLATSIVLSIALTLVFWLINRFTR